jgi:squalene-associated FAD-dependent desaturase
LSASRIAVVGGGLAGLAAALECADAGADVVLYEARPRLGGATFSVRRKEHWIDNGQHVFLRACSAYLDFLDRIGSADLVSIQPSLRVPVLREGRPPALLSRNRVLPAPFHLLGALLRYRPLALSERLAVVRAAGALRRLDPDDPELDELGFGEWLRAHHQTERAASSLWELIAVATLNLRLDEVSLAPAVKVFRTGLLDSVRGGDIGVATVPLQELHGEAAARALEEAGVRAFLSSPVRSLRREDGRLRLGLGGRSEEADAVICAVPHHALAALVPGRAVDATVLERLGTSPIVNLHLHYDRPVLREPFAAALDSPVQWLFDASASSGVRSGQLLTLSVSAARREIKAPLRDLRRRYLPALERLLPEAREAELLDLAVTREPRATFRAAPGSGRLRSPQRTAVEGLYLAGAWTDTGWPATMEGAVRSGLAAARSALDDLGTSASRESRTAPVAAGEASRWE